MKPPMMAGSHPIANPNNRPHANKAYPQMAINATTPVKNAMVLYDMSELTGV